MKKILLPGLCAATVVLMGTSCQKQAETSKIDVSNITMFDEYSQHYGLVDASDWNFTDKFSKDEEALFPADNHEVCNFDYSSYSVVAFPNPNNGNFSFATDVIQDEGQVQIRIVDENLNVLYEIDTLYNNFLGFSEILENGQTSQTRTVRLYYRIFLDESCKVQGHGDIRIQGK